VRGFNTMNMNDLIKKLSPSEMKREIYILHDGSGAKLDSVEVFSKFIELKTK